VPLSRGQVYYNPRGSHGQRRPERRQYGAARVKGAELFEPGLQVRKEFVMGDKGGKKDKEKSQKQKTSKQQQSAKGKQDKNRAK
jgi:hypothetical protein